MSVAPKQCYKRNRNGDLLIKSNRYKNVTITLKEPLKVIDLQEACLKKLQLETLSCVADHNIRLKCLVYDFLLKKCDGTTVSVYCTNNVQWLWFADTKGKFMFNDVSKLDDFFRKAGKSITNLSITCAPITLISTYQSVEQSIANHCFESLTTIEMRSNHLPILDKVTHIFSNVAQLTLDGCELSESLCQQFEQYFPSLRRLVLHECKTFDPSCIERNFKYLNELIVVGKRKNRKVFNKSSVQGALRHNPQITKLTIDFSSTNDREFHNVHPDFALDANYYRFVSETLPKLTSLKLFGERKFQSDKCEDDIEFVKLDKLVMCDIYGQEPNEIAPFVFNQLRELKLMHMTTLSDEWMKFIIRNDCLEKLTMDIVCKWLQEEETQEQQQTLIDKEQLMTIVKGLSKLKELHVSAAAVDPKDVMAILSKQKSLMKVCLRDYSDIDSIVERFDKLTAKKRWHVGYDLYNLILERKN